LGEKSHQVGGEWITLIVYLFYFIFAQYDSYKKNILQALAKHFEISHKK
jgi:hypothetical protein